MISDTKTGRRPQVVIVGGGFGGIAAARAMRRGDADITLVDRQNHHLFQPLLYQVATAALSPAEIAWPIRRILRRQQNVRVVMASVRGVDTDTQTVELGDRELHYDYLVLACGSTHAYFGNDDWAAHAPGLKDLHDATAIRRQLLRCFERAELEDDPARRAELLTFAVIGGGPTGVEMAGAISELARHAMKSEFRRITPDMLRVLLIEAGDSLLAGFPQRLRNYAVRALGRLGVEVRLGSPVTAIDAQGIVFGDTRVDAATTIWAAGVSASPLAHDLPAGRDRHGRIRVDSRLRVGELDNVFAIGDMVVLEDENGKPLPGVAAVAKQQGAFVGKAIAATLAGTPRSKPFRYRDVGMLATIGRRAAIADLGWLRMRGWLAWWFWGLVHIYFLINSRSRIIVAVNWLWSYLTYDRSARLIIDDQASSGQPR